MSLFFQSTTHYSLNLELYYIQHPFLKKTKKCEWWKLCLGSWPFLKTRPQDTKTKVKAFSFRKKKRTWKRLYFKNVGKQNFPRKIKKTRENILPTLSGLSFMYLPLTSAFGWPSTTSVNRLRFQVYVLSELSKFPVVTGGLRY